MNPITKDPGGSHRLSGLFSGKIKEPKEHTVPMQETTATPEGTNNLINNTIHPINPDTPRHSYSNLQGSGVTVHNYTLPSIELRVNRVDIFIIHESRVSKFTSLNKLIEDSRHTGSEIDTPVISVHGDSTLASDFRNTFDMLDTCLIEPINFSSEVLVSAARISAAYGYPSLRAFCIKQLEGLSLGPIERLQIGRALDLKSWEERTYQELSEREETITEEEMLALGINAYFQVASMRERRQKDQINQLSTELRAKTALWRSAYKSESPRENKPEDTLPAKPKDLPLPTVPKYSPLPTKPKDSPLPTEPKPKDSPLPTKPRDSPKDSSRDGPRDSPVDNKPRY